MKTNRDEWIIDIINYFLLTLVTISMLYPFVNVIAVSLSDYSAYLDNPLMIWPKNINVSAFTYVFGNGLILSSYRNTVFITVVGTVADLLLIIITAYPLSKKELKGKVVAMNLIIITMLFNGGLIPNFYLVRSLGMLDTMSALIVPSFLSAFYIILMKNFFENIPQSLEEAAKVDGASEIYVLMNIFIPLSKPILATLALFISVDYWNSFFSAIIYIRSQSKWTLQLVLREIMMAANTQLLQNGGNAAEMRQVPTETLKYATLIVVILPILCVYPFLQKYFVKGMMVGAVKG